MTPLKSHQAFTVAREPQKSCFTVVVRMTIQLRLQVGCRFVTTCVVHTEDGNREQNCVMVQIIFKHVLCVVQRRPCVGLQTENVLNFGSQLQDITNYHILHRCNSSFSAVILVAYLGIALHYSLPDQNVLVCRHATEAEIL